MHAVPVLGAGGAPGGGGGGAPPPLPTTVPSSLLGKRSFSLNMGLVKQSLDLPELFARSIEEIGNKVLINRLPLTFTDYFKVQLTDDFPPIKGQYVMVPVYFQVTTDATGTTTWQPFHLRPNISSTLEPTIHPTDEFLEGIEILKLGFYLCEVVDYVGDAGPGPTHHQITLRITMQLNGASEDASSIPFLDEAAAPAGTIVTFVYTGVMVFSPTETLLRHPGIPKILAPKPHEHERSALDKKKQFESYDGTHRLIQLDPLSAHTAALKLSVFTLRFLGNTPRCTKLLGEGGYNPIADQIKQDLYDVSISTNGTDSGWAQGRNLLQSCLRLPAWTKKFHLFITGQFSMDPVSGLTWSDFVDPSIIPCYDRANSVDHLIAGMRGF